MNMEVRRELSMCWNATNTDANAHVWVLKQDLKEVIDLKYINPDTGRKA